MNNINDETRAREIIDAAMTLNVSIIKTLNLFKATEGGEPEITDEECKSIATNYHFSWRDIREIFKRRI